MPKVLRDTTNLYALLVALFPIDLVIRYIIIFNNIDQELTQDL
jgi:hypothetical protein